MMRSRLLAPLLAVAAFCATLPAAEPAHAAPGTLDKIRAHGVIHLGYRLSSVPFSYVDGNGEVIGYSHAFALRVVDAVRRHLDLARLEVRLVPITSQNRFMLIDSGRIDLECGSTTHNREREALASFSTTIFIAGTRLLVPQDSAIDDFDDLVGKRVVTTAGTTSESHLRRLNETHDRRLTIVSTRDHAESYTTLRAGRASAFMLDDALLYGERARSGEAEAWRVTGTPRSYEAYACTLRRGDAAFKRVVDAAIADTMRSGEAERLYARWFTRPIPPFGLNLEFPLSAPMRELYRHPNDRPLE